MFRADVFVHHDRRVISTGTGKTATAAITAARTDKQVNDTVGVDVYEDGDDPSRAWSLVFTAFDYGVPAAIKAAHAMNRKSRACGGR
jgi:hypothetical protein